MTLADIRDWLKTIRVGAEHYYAGKIDAGKEKVIGVYERPEYGPAEVALGGLETTKTLHRRLSILVHWNRNAKETESAARYLYNNLLCAENVTIGGIHIDVLALGVPYPVDVGTDDSGIFERVIWIDLYYQKED